MSKKMILSVLKWMKIEKKIYLIINFTFKLRIDILIKW